MIIWSRWGILALLIPVLPILLAEGVMELSVSDDSPPVRAKIANDSDDTDVREKAEELKAAQRKREEEHLHAVTRAKRTGFGIGCLIGAAAIWPLGRWMNKPESRMLIDPQSGESFQMRSGGGNTLFFVPMEYWSFIWLVVGFYKFVT